MGDVRPAAGPRGRQPRGPADPVLLRADRRGAARCSSRSSLLGLLWREPRLRPRTAGWAVPPGLQRCSTAGRCGSVLRVLGLLATAYVRWPRRSGSDDALNPTAGVGVRAALGRRRRCCRCCSGPVWRLLNPFRGLHGLLSRADCARWPERGASRATRAGSATGRRRCRCSPSSGSSWSHRTTRRCRCCARCSRPTRRCSCWRDLFGSRWFDRGRRLRGVVRAARAAVGVRPARRRPAGGARPAVRGGRDTDGARAVRGGGRAARLDGVRLVRQLARGGSARCRRARSTRGCWRPSACWPPWCS